MNSKSQLLRVKDVASFLNMGVSSVWAKLHSDPTFPKPFKLSAKITVWRLSDLIMWVEQKIKSQN